jgi:hypothetical protein
MTPSGPKVSVERGAGVAEALDDAFRLGRVPRVPDRREVALNNLPRVSISFLVSEEDWLSLRDWMEAERGGWPDLPPVGIEYMGYPVHKDPRRPLRERGPS